MKDLVLTNANEILQTLSKIALYGDGFVTDCLVAEVMDAGITSPDFLRASGSDPEATYDGEANAWSDIQVRESKKVFMVYGGKGKARRFQIADTP